MTDLDTKEQKAIEEVFRCVRKTIKIPDEVAETFRATAYKFPEGAEKEEMLKELSKYVEAHKNDNDEQGELHSSRNSLAASSKRLMTLMAVGVSSWTLYNMSARGKLDLKEKLAVAPEGTILEASLSTDNTG